MISMTAPHDMVLDAMKVDEHLTRCHENHGKTVLWAAVVMHVIGPTRSGYTPGELARLLHVSSGGTTHVIDQLVKAGWARRAEHPSPDRRLIEVQLTDVGRRKAIAFLSDLP